jgi:membrane protease subunit HflC
MRTARQQEARTIGAEGPRAQIVRARPMPKLPHLCRGFGKDPEFYNFYRMMQSYRETFLGSTGNPRRPSYCRQK